MFPGSHICPEYVESSSLNPFKTELSGGRREDGLQLTEFFTGREILPMKNSLKVYTIQYANSVLSRSSLPLQLFCTAVMKSGFS
jgi:hypothetical protein